MRKVKTNTMAGRFLILAGIVGIFIPLVPGLLLIGSGLDMLNKGNLPRKKCRR